MLCIVKMGKRRDLCMDNNFKNIVFLIAKNNQQNKLTTTAFRVRYRRIQAYRYRYVWNEF